MKANWNGYSTELDKLIEDVEPIPANSHVLYSVYVQHPEDTYHENLEHSTFPVLLSNQSVYMKNTSASIQTDPLTTVPYNLETH